MQNCPAINSHPNMYESKNAFQIFLSETNELKENESWSWSWSEVARPDVPIFTTLNVDGPFSLPPAPAPPYSMRPPLCDFNCVKEGRDHCYECGRCDILCRDHNACTCERDEDEDDGTNCAVSCCFSDVRYAIPKTPLPNRKVIYLL